MVLLHFCSIRVASENNLWLRSPHYLFVQLLSLTSILILLFLQKNLWVDYEIWLIIWKIELK